jgi:glucan phosphoethanolaminetransferase (alkaline phosphatase superfamily)
MSQADLNRKLNAAFASVCSATEWTFKFVGWLIIIATLRYAADATQNTYFLIAGVFLQMLVTVVLTLFIWRLSNVVSVVKRPLLQLIIIILLGLGVILLAYFAQLALQEAIQIIVEFQRAESAR